MSFEASKNLIIDTDKIKKGRQEWTEEELSELPKAVKDQTAIQDMDVAKNRTTNAIYKKGWSIGFRSTRKDGVLYFKPDKYQRKKRRVLKPIIHKPMPTASQVLKPPTVLNSDEMVYLLDLLLLDYKLKKNQKDLSLIRKLSSLLEVA